MRFTVLGASGFIGRNLASALQARGSQTWLPERDDPQIFKRPLGTVYYCIGLTADFRNRPFDTVDAHVGLLRQILEHADFEQLLYLSSTRVYQECLTAEETQRLTVAPFVPDDLYNLSKLLGESLALSSGRNCRVARLSNVLGPDMGPSNFVGGLLAEALETGSVLFHTGLASEKDYLWIDDAVNGLIATAEKGRKPIYNIAGGVNIRHEAIANLLASKGIRISVADNAPINSYPVISITNLMMDTGVLPPSVIPKLSAWLNTVFGPGS